MRVSTFKEHSMREIGRQFCRDDSPAFGMVYICPKRNEGGKAFSARHLARIECQPSRTARGRARKRPLEIPDGPGAPSLAELRQSQNSSNENSSVISREGKAGAVKQLSGGARSLVSMEAALVQLPGEDPQLCGELGSRVAVD
jgi:hypothetical protein